MVQQISNLAEAKEDMHWWSQTSSLQRIPQYAEVPPNIEAIGIITGFSAALSG
jgi:hypothetical protein